MTRRQFLYSILQAIAALFVKKFVVYLPVIQKEEHVEKSLPVSELTFPVTFPITFGTKK